MVSPASVGPPAQMFFICDEADEDIAQECVHLVRAETPAQAVTFAVPLYLRPDLLVFRLRWRVNF